MTRVRTSVFAAIGLAAASLLAAPAGAAPLGAATSGWADQPGQLQLAGGDGWRGNMHSGGKHFHKGNRFRADDFYGRGHFGGGKGRYKRSFRRGYAEGFFDGRHARGPFNHYGFYQSPAHRHPYYRGGSGVYFGPGYGYFKAPGFYFKN